MNMFYIANDSICVAGFDSIRSSTDIGVRDRGDVTTIQDRSGKPRSQALLYFKGLYDKEFLSYMASLIKRRGMKGIAYTEFGDIFYELARPDGESDSIFIDPAIKEAEKGRVVRIRLDSL